MSEALPPKILDVTIRDGGYQIHHQVKPETVQAVMKGLAEAGIQYAEVSHGCGIGGKLQGLPAFVDDEILMEAAKLAAPEIKLSATIPPTDFSASLLPALIEFIDIGRIMIDSSNPGQADKVFQKLIKYQKLISIQLVWSHRFSPEALAETAKALEDKGANIVYVVDTYGSMQPNDVKNYIHSLRSRCGIPIGFHGHNHIGMAIANTLEAWNAGAEWLDASLMGVGRDGGNTHLESLIVCLQQKGGLPDINISRLCETTQSAILPLFEDPPVSRYLDLLLSEFKLDHPNKKFLTLVANGIRVPLRDFFITLQKVMGNATTINDEHIKAATQEYGQDLFDKIAASFKEDAKTV